ncbi:DUF3810 domain-containing protein [Maribellus sp. YY47]|uniref:DUF3810 domain-containing protein n=1 Tax=Maribellus sp. YY47 TaxID=2929486 RepID=UPI0020015802|nr:DUF3810 domain-containing protein [Maribellus sp. YY47]MCK3685491.1 DUF3810 domain-containing protein [Maribellus sp. YY47]
MQKGFKHTIRWWVFPLLAIVCFAFTEMAAKHPAIVENWYSNGMYPMVAGSISTLSSLIPISIDDLFYLALLACLPALMVLLAFRKISFGFAGKFILTILSSLYILFYVLWGFNYYRQNINQRLGIDEQQPTQEEFLSIVNQLIAQTNQNYCSSDSLTPEDTDSLIERSYQKLAPVLRLSYPAGKRPDKAITFSHFFAQSGITGYFGPFFNEVHVNTYTLPLEYPVTLAHEKAHQFGITSEAEANFYAWLVCSQSHSKPLNYTADLYLLRHFLRQAYQLKEYPELAAKISPEVKTDFNRIRQHWMELRNEKLDRAASTVNDAYLKTNKVEGGIQDYSGVVKLVLDFKLDSTFQKTHSYILSE